MVEVAHVAAQLFQGRDGASGVTGAAGRGGEGVGGLGRQQVELKLSQMILDKKLHGVLDQQRGIVEIYEERVADVSHSLCSSLGRIVD